MDPFKTMDPLGQTPPKDLLSNADGQNQATPPATTPVRIGGGEEKEGGIEREKGSERERDGGRERES